MKMSRLTFAALLLIASVPLALAQGTYTQIDYPGATWTWAQGIDDAGDIVGWYSDTAGNEHGFLLSGGVYTSIDYPGAKDTVANGVNDEGQVVGGSLDPEVGFLYDVQTQTFTIINYPGATFTNPESINDAGRIVGFLEINASVLGFKLTGSTYDLIQASGSGTTLVYGIDALGELVGDFTSVSGAPYKFSFYQGKYQRVRIPHIGVTNSLSGVNSKGTALVGIYQESQSDWAGFLYQNRVLHTLQFPGTNYTSALGVNAAGEVVGFFADSSENYHGFTWTPPADAAQK